MTISIKNLERLRRIEATLAAVNFDLLVFTQVTLDRIAEDFEGNPWDFVEFEPEMHPPCSAIPTVHYHIKKLPFVSVQYLEREGLRIPHLYATYGDGDVDPTILDQLEEGLDQLQKILKFFI